MASNPDPTIKTPESAKGRKPGSPRTRLKLSIRKEDPDPEIGPEHPNLAPKSGDASDPEAEAGGPGEAGQLHRRGEEASGGPLPGDVQLD